jgi:ankyrin repeat protein
LDAVDAKGRTALHIAASHGAETFIKAALESGMNVDAVNSSVLSKVKLVQGL